MGKIILMVLLIAALTFLGCIFGNAEHSPSGDTCKIDSDCVCTLTCPDCCGKAGQSWKCVENKCKLEFYNNPSQ